MGEINICGHLEREVNKKGILILICPCIFGFDHAHSLRLQPTPCVSNQQDILAPFQGTCILKEVHVQNQKKDLKSQHCQ